MWITGTETDEGALPALLWQVFREQSLNQHGVGKDRLNGRGMQVKEEMPGLGN